MLRRFELRLLEELGYAVALDRDAGSGAAIAAHRSYVYLIERGPVEAAALDSGKGVELSGATLLDMKSGNYEGTVTQQQSKMLMRTLIDHYLGHQVLHTRQMLRELQDL